MADQDPVVITEAVARRIASCVTQWERFSKGGASNLPTTPNNIPGGFWAQIDDGDEYGYYSWTQIDCEGGNCTEDNNLQTGSYSDDNAAYEISGAEYVLNQSKVYLMPMMTDSYYVFSYRGGVYNGTISADISSGYSGTVTVTLDDGSTTQDIQAYNGLGVTVKYSDGANVMVGFGQQAQWWIIAQTCNASGG